MTAQTTTAPREIVELQDGALNEDWAGFGYLGERRHYKTADVAVIDRLVITYANLRRWTAEQLFDWANSSNGRHFADAIFSGADLDKCLAWGLLDLPKG